MKAVAAIAALILVLAIPTAASAQRHNWGTSTHTSSHGGTYVGGVGSSHKGGHYIGPFGGYGCHKC